MRLEAEENNMKRMKVKFWIFLIYALVLSGAVHAQTANCSQRLSDAQARFDIGNLSGIAELILPCMNSGFTPEEDIRAHKLMTLVYLYQDDQENADKWMVELLKTDPEHKLDSLNDPREIFFHYSQFKTNPVFRVRLSGGLNTTFVNSLTAYGLENTSGGDPGVYSGALKLNLLTEIEKQIYRGLEGGLGLNFATRGWNLEKTLEDSTTSLAGGENQAWIELPVTLRYTHYLPGRVCPYLFAGGSASFLLSSDANMAKNVQITLGRNNNFIEQGIRERLHYFVFAGAGAKFRFKTDFFLIDLRYLNGLTLINSADRFAGDPDIALRTGYIDSNFGINNLMFSIGYQKSFYNPKKLRQR